MNTLHPMLTPSDQRQKKLNLQKREPEENEQE